MRDRHAYVGSHTNSPKRSLVTWPKRSPPFLPTSCVRGGLTKTRSSCSSISVRRSPKEVLVGERSKLSLLRSVSRRSSRTSVISVRTRTLTQITFRCVSGGSALSLFSSFSSFSCVVILPLKHEAPLFYEGSDIWSLKSSRSGLAASLPELRVKLWAARSLTSRPRYTAGRR
jgi:hypothetical protein